MTFRIAGLSLAAILIGLLVSAPHPQAQGAVPDPVFFQTQVMPVFEAAKCSGCHTSSGVASATRLHFPDKDATPVEIQAFGLSLAALVDRSNPSQSLILAKPTNTIRHTGGVRIVGLFASRDFAGSARSTSALRDSPKDCTSFAVASFSGK